MKRMFRAAAVMVTAAAIVLGGTNSARAVEAFDGRIELHGYAHQAFMISNSFANKYLGTDPHGSFDQNALALLFSFKATDDLRIWAQLYADSDSRMRLDWAYADYRVNDWLRVRGGQIKTPLGLLNETRDIKYLHLSTLEPLLYQEGSEVMFESFRGASVLLEHEVAGGAIKLDLFGGAPVFFESRESEEKHYGLFGARLMYETPLDGLLVGGNYLRSNEKRDGVSGKKEVYGGSLEFMRAGLDLHGEYFTFSEVERRGHGYYVEAGYTIKDQWVPFARYDYLTCNEDMKSDPLHFQEAVSFGLTYKFNRFASLRVEDHIIKGYVLPGFEYGEANAEAIEDKLMPADLLGDKHWNLFAVSLNLMF
jgi:hypothetical protein